VKIAAIHRGPDSTMPASGNSDGQTIKAQGRPSLVLDDILPGGLQQECKLAGGFVLQHVFEFRANSRGVVWLPVDSSDEAVHARGSSSRSPVARAAKSFCRAASKSGKPEAGRINRAVTVKIARCQRLHLDFGCVAVSAGSRHALHATAPKLHNLRRSIAHLNNQLALPCRRRETVSMPWPPTCHVPAGPVTASSTAVTGPALASTPATLSRKSAVPMGNAWSRKNDQCHWRRSEH